MPASDDTAKAATAANLDDLTLLVDAARRGGQMALGYFRNDPKRWTKDNDSPVSEADIAVDRYLAELLRGARTGYGWLSEETADDPARLGMARTFIVDPIDGTRAFLAGSPDWTVAVAVVEAGRPVAAAVYRPASDEMYTATVGGGAALNGEPLRVSTMPSLEGARLAGPKPMVTQEAVRRAGVVYGGYVPSLALRIALVAAGRIDLAAARERACDWDLAAADLLVQEAGGRLENMRGGPVLYNRANVRHPALLAGPEALVTPLRPILADLT
ncbi:3'(2'),5'-bisphosphate nucleotidase CysQ [Stappia taiwanensis]|nr:3'(2'),5'-bisphosphate nucleotidase CysQ [Stappia taiwanensis]GGE91780.1 3'(2'),5'-bisphosphate nucleotidase CysQ [Stappia taiwanensis]